MVKSNNLAFTLAEVFHPAGRSSKFAFTLAEVLITLGIIGVVAVLTLPQLIQNYQKKVWVAQLQKTMAIVQNSFKLVISREEVETLSDTKLWKNINNYSYNISSSFIKELSLYMPLDKKCMDVENPMSNRECNFFYRKSNSTGSILKKLNGKETASTSSAPFYKSIYLNNGAIISFLFLNFPSENFRDKQNIAMHGGNLYEQVGGILIDVNGEKNPNQFGRDIFSFILGNDGVLYTPNGKNGIIYTHFRSQNTPIKNHEQLVEQNCPKFEPAITLCGKTQPDGEIAREQSKYKCDKTLTGNHGYYDSIFYAPDACAEKIISEGWKMNY